MKNNITGIQPKITMKASTTGTESKSPVSNKEIKLSNEQPIISSKSVNSSNKTNTVSTSTPPKRQPSEFVLRMQKQNQQNLTTGDKSLVGEKFISKGIIQTRKSEFNHVTKNVDVKQGTQRALLARSKGLYTDFSLESAKSGKFDATREKNLKNDHVFKSMEKTDQQQLLLAFKKDFGKVNYNTEMFKGLQMENVRFERSDLKEFNFEGSSLFHGNMVNTNLDGANLKGAKLETATINGSSARGANFDGANLKETKFRDSDLTGADFSKAEHMFDCNFNHSNLSAAKFGDVHGVRFDNCTYFIPIGTDGQRLTDSSGNSLLAPQFKLTENEIKEGMTLDQMAKKMGIEGIEIAASELGVTGMKMSEVSQRFI